MNDVTVNKITSIQRCIKRAREEYTAAQNNFENEYTHQDAAILNITRACEQSIDLANHIIKIKKLGIPTDSSESFDLLYNGGIITGKLREALKKMVGFRNTIIHEYQEIDINIVINIIKKNLEDLLQFTDTIMEQSKKENFL
jgi:uncharacterized protein YutE (UPF0331/DUF86 family)